MKASALLLMWTAALALCATGLVLTGWSAAGASDHLARASEAFVVAHDQAAELERLRALAPREGDRPAEPEDLPRRVSGVIRGCGLPASAMGSFDAAGVARESDTTTRRASLVLQHVTLPQLGRFLSEWRTAEPCWTVTSIEVVPRGEAPAAGGDLPLQAVISLQSMVRAAGAHP